MSEDSDAVDVIVVGAGLAGIACAYRLALAGRSVVLVERGTVRIDVAQEVLETLRR